MDTMSLGGLTSRSTGALVGWELAMAATFLSLPTILFLHGAVRLTVVLLFIGGDLLQ